MSEFRLSFPAWFLAGKSRLSAENLLTLRKVSFPDGIETSDDAALLLAIHHSMAEKCDEWDAFFIEALSRFIVHNTHPQGALDDVNIAWLIRILSRDGIIESPTEFEVLMHVIDIVHDVPAALSAFALDQLRHALDGKGAYRSTRSLDSNGITRHDLEYMRYVLRHSTDADGLKPVEIEALDRIDRASNGQANHGDWMDFRRAMQWPQGDRSQRSPWLRVPMALFADVETAA